MRLGDVFLRATKAELTQPRGCRIAGIELRRLRGKPKYLGQFTGGAAPVYRQIRSRWEKWVVENRE